MNAEPGTFFERRFQNQLSDLSRVTEEAAKFLQENGVGPRPVYLAELAIEEMATNILKYGYDDTVVHEIRLRLQFEPGSLLILIEDDGHEFNPLEAPEPHVDLPAEQREPGGLGIHLIRKLAAQMSYQRCKGRNHVTIRVALAEPMADANDD